MGWFDRRHNWKFQRQTCQFQNKKTKMFEYLLFTAKAKEIGFIVMQNQGPEKIYFWKLQPQILNTNVHQKIWKTTLKFNMGFQTPYCVLQEKDHI